MRNTLLFVLIIQTFLGNINLSGQANKMQPVDLVYPLTDAANSRWFFFNSATRPFGMVNLSPDNAIDALSLVLTGLRLQKKAQHEDLIESIINRISMLDPVKALQIV
mgnify:CR=1 FL=1